MRKNLVCRPSHGHLYRNIGEAQMYLKIKYVNVIFAFGLYVLMF